ncbi:MAG: hypothetical protein AAF573_07185 [Bacteroidota bacterium]
MTILKNIGLAILLVGLILFLGKAFVPENAMRVGSGFHRHTPALSYPIKLAFVSAIGYLVLSLFLDGKKLWISYVIVLLCNLGYLFYCLKTYVEN